MGVRGLLKYIRSDRSKIKLDSVRLFKRGEGKLVLVCDLMAVFYWLIELMHKAKVICKDYSPYSAIYGGNFRDYKERILEFVKALRFVGIEPLFFWDGPHGADYDYELKLDTWKERCIKVLTKVKGNAEICKFHAAEIKFEKRIKQTLLFDELVCALRNEKVTVVVCEGEADNAMAQYARVHREVCTILTNDTDMALMSGCSMIHYKFFDRRDALELNQLILRRPHEICCDIMKPQYLARDLNIDEKCLPALSILCGNDFTTIFNQEIRLRDIFGFTYPFVITISVWIKHHESDCKSAKSFLGIRQIEEICDKFPEYRKAIIYSYKFYQSSNPDSKRTVAPKSPICDFVTEKVKNHQMNRSFLALAKTGIMWRDEIEQLDENMPCIHELLLPVRIVIYKLLCIRNVVEYGQRGVCEYVEVPIDLNPCMTETLSALTKLPFGMKMILIFNALKTCPVAKNLLEIDDNAITDTMLLPGVQKFSHTDLDQLQPNDIEGDTEYLAAALTCACILFAIRNNKTIADNYCVPLIMTCFCCAMDETPPKLAARPGPTGVTIASQFMVILQHARWIASLVGLEEMLPLPSTIFQPFMYIPLHGAAFKLCRKERFYNDDLAVKEFYNDFSLNKHFKKFTNSIASAECHIEIVDLFLKTKALLLDEKKSAASAVAATKTSKAKKGK